MPLHPKIKEVTDRIVERSGETRADYLERMARAGEAGPGTIEEINRWLKP